MRSSPSEAAAGSPKGRNHGAICRSARGETPCCLFRWELLGLPPVCTDRRSLFQGMPAAGPGPIYEGLVSGFYSSIPSALSFCATLSQGRQKEDSSRSGPGSYQGTPWCGGDPVRKGGLAQGRGMSRRGNAPGIRPWWPNPPLAVKSPGIPSRPE